MNGLKRVPVALRLRNSNGMPAMFSRYAEPHPSLDSSQLTSPRRGAVASRAAAPSSATLPRPAPLDTRSPPYAHTSLRPFSHAAVLGAKKHREKVKKAAARDEDEDEDEVGEDQLPSESRRRARDRFAPPSDFDHEAAFDLADVDAEYARADERFERRVREFRAGGGRFNPELLGQLPVQPDRGSPQTYPLRELASVVPRGGRAVSVIVSDAAYVKPVMSAVQASEEFNQQPQRDPDNDLELVLRIEPENPEEQAKRLKGECNAWKDAVRGVLATRKSKHATWLKAKHLTKDDVKNLDKKVKAMQDKKIEAIEKKEKQLQVELASRQKRL